MSKTKRGFIKAGSILAIIVSIFTIIGYVSISIIKDYVTEDAVVEVLKQEDDFEYVPLEEDYKFIYEDDEYKFTIPSDNVKSIVKIINNISVASLYTTVCFAALSFIIAVAMLVQLKSNKSKNSFAIIQLILSLILDNTLTFAFMIVVLCLKDKHATLDNINEIVIDKE